MVKLSFRPQRCQGNKQRVAERPGGRSALRLHGARAFCYDDAQSMVSTDARGKGSGGDPRKGKL